MKQEYAIFSINHIKNYTDRHLQNYIGEIHDRSIQGHTVWHYEAPENLYKLTREELEEEATNAYTADTVPF